MEILELNASFGKLDNRKLLLSKGLNVIYAPNEAGKSTWCQFLRVMLYGLQGRGEMADKNRYAPWSGAVMSGVMRVSDSGTQYTITRSTRRADSPMGDLKCTYSDTGDAANILDGKEPGEVFLEIPQNVFSRSAFIGQSALRIDSDPELEQRIISLITTGEESPAYSVADKRLKEQLNRRKHNRTGLIPVLEDECSEMRRHVSRIEELQERSADALDRINYCLREKALLEEYCDRWVQINAQRDARRALQQYSTAQQRLRELRSAVTEAEALLTSHPLYGKTDEELNGRLAALQVLPASGSWKQTYLFGTLAACGAMACGAMLYRHLTVPAIASAAVLVLSLGFLLRYKILKEKKAQDASRAVSEAEALRRQIAELHDRKQQCTNAKTLCRQCEEICKDLPPVPDVDMNPIARPPIDTADSKERLAQMEASAIELRSKYDQLQGQLVAEGDVGQLRAKLARKEAELQKLQGEYESVLLAISALDAANTTLQNRFSPQLGRRSAEILAGITAGKYQKVLLSRDFRIEAGTADDPIARACNLLSQGTVDQLYLAVRLAICDMILCREKPVPLVLDDALLSFDEERLQAALDYLLELGRDRQILLFTCQKREGDYLSRFREANVICL